MDAFYQWLKNMVCLLCVLELLYHVVPQESYQRYLRFFGGMVFLLVTVSPLLNLFQLRTSFDEALRMFSLEEEAFRVTEAGKMLAELQNTAIEEAYGRELERQVETLAKGHGRTPVDTSVEVVYDEADMPQIKEICLTLSGTEEGTKEIAAEICALYKVERAAVKIKLTGGLE